MLVVAERWSGPSSRKRPSGTRPMSWEGSRLPSSKPQNKTPLESWRLGQRCPFRIDIICHCSWQCSCSDCIICIKHSSPTTSYCARGDKALEFQLTWRCVMQSHVIPSYLSPLSLCCSVSGPPALGAYSCLEFVVDLASTWNPHFAAASLFPCAPRQAPARPSWKERQQWTARAAGLGSGAT